MVCAPFLGFRNFIHNGIVVLQQPPPLFHVVCFQNLLTGFLNGQFQKDKLFSMDYESEKTNECFWDI